MQPAIVIACRGAKGELLGELTLADRRGRPTLSSVNGAVSISELGDYFVRLDGPTAGTLRFTPPVEALPTSGGGEIVGLLGYPPSLGVVPIGLASADGSLLWRQTLMVRPEKLRDLGDFERMVDDLCRWRTSLALDLHAHTSASWAWSDAAPALSAEERLIVLRAAIEDNRLFENLIHIERSSLARLERNIELVRLGREEVDPARLGRYINSPGERVVVPASHPLAARVSSLPMWLPPARKVETVDTPENQFVKAVIRHLREALYEAKRDLPYYADSPILNWAERAEQHLAQILASPFFSRVSWPAHLSLGSPALQRREGYRNVLQVFLNLRAGFSVVWEELGRSIFAETRDVPTVYEFWCLVRLRAALEAEFGADLDLDHFLTNYGRISVRRGGVSHSRTAVLLHGQPYALSLHYNRTFWPVSGGAEGGFNIHGLGIGTWSKPMKPDFSISLRPKDLSETQAAACGLLRLVHLDAKYRLRRIGADVVTHAPDDLDKMHAYAASINHSKGAYALYPGEAGELYAAPAASGAAVGAIPLAPGRSNTLNAALRLVLEKATIP